MVNLFIFYSHLCVTWLQCFGHNLADLVSCKRKISNMFTRGGDFLNKVVLTL